jgi:hypothetical protein
MSLYERFQPGVNSIAGIIIGSNSSETDRFGSVRTEQTGGISMRSTLRSAVSLAALALFALAALPSGAADKSEHGLLGIKIWRNYSDVLRLYGRPTRIEPGAVTTPTAGGQQMGGGGMTGFAPGMGGRPGGLPGMGGTTGMLGVAPGGMPGGLPGMMSGGMPGMMSGGPPGMMSPGGAGMGAMMSAGRGMPGMMSGGGMGTPGRRGMPGLPGSGMMSGGMMPGGGLSAPSGMMGMGGRRGAGGDEGGMMPPMLGAGGGRGAMLPGGGGEGMSLPGMGGGVQQGETTEAEQTWIYEKNGGQLTYYFLLNKDGRVIQVQEFGYKGGGPTSRGVRLGDPVEKLYKTYGWPDSTTKMGNQLTLDYSRAAKVAFQLVDRGKGMMVVGITVALTEMDQVNQ